MNNDEFVKNCIGLVAGWFDAHIDKTDGVSIKPHEIYVVWLSKTLQNNKALLSTTFPDGMYYEVTYNGDKHEMYLDAYKKFDNQAIKIGE